MRGRYSCAVGAQADMGGNGKMPMTDELNARPSWLERRRERKRLKRERTGDSPEKLEQHHAPPADSMDTALKLFGVERESRFRPDRK